MKASDLEQNITNVNSAQPPVKNVEAAFARISRRGDYFSVHPNGGLPRWLYTQSGENNNNGYQNHFQGIQRLQEKNHLVISGGDWRNSKSDLFIVKIGSRPEKGAWWSNIITAQDPPQSDAIIASIELDKKNWHAGGMDVQGDILAVPLEYSPPDSIVDLFGIKPPDYGNVQSSMIMFFDLSIPAQPKKFPFEIKRERTKAGAIALTQLQNDYFLAAVWTDSDNRPQKRKRLEFYVSKTKKFKDGFNAVAWTWYPEDLLSFGEQDRKFGDYQAINFILQEDGQLYLVGFHNTSSVAPLPFGTDYADLYFIEIHEGALKSSPEIDPNRAPKITKVANLNFECQNRQCNFDAGTGVYINEGELFVYSTFHFRGQKGILKFNEYLPPYKGLSRGLNEKNSWTEMFQETHFHGRRLAIRGTTEMTQPNFESLRAEKQGFGDQASSIRFQLPKETKCLLYQDKDFKKKLPLELVGTNEVVEIPQLAENVKRKISSMKFVKL